MLYIFGMNINAEPFIKNCAAKFYLEKGPIKN